MVAAAGVVLDLVDDAPVQHLGLVELAAFNQVAGKEMTPRLPDLDPELIGAAAGEGRGQLTAGSTLVLPGDGGVILQAEVDPMLTTFVEYAMRLLPFLDWDVVLRLVLCWYCC